MGLVMMAPYPQKMSHLMPTRNSSPAKPERSLLRTSQFFGSEDITVFCAFRLTFDGIDKPETTTLPLVYFYLTQQCFRHYHQGQKKI